MIKKLKSVLLILGLLMLFCTTLSMFFVNFNFGFIILSGISGIFILYGLFFEKLIRIKWLTYSIFVCGLLFVAIVLFVGFYGRNDNVSFGEDAVIVLGAGIRGEKVTLTLACRLDRAVEYSFKNPKAIIVVSGGQGPQESITEALAMERYLLNAGVPGERIFREEESTSTYENLLFSKEILDNQFDSSDNLFDSSYGVVVITSDFHIYRASKLAEKLGLKAAHYHAKTKWYNMPLNYSRESIAVIKFWLLGK